MSDIDRDKWNQRYCAGAYSERSHPSTLLLEWIEHIPPGAALDVACGAGRNALYLASRGFAVDAVDISSAALERARDSAQQLGVQVNWLERDLDEQLVLDRAYQLIVVIRYVNLPLIRRLTASLAPGGFLLCEQHLLWNADVIGPTNPAYRLKPGDLRAVAPGLKVLHVEEGIVTEPDGHTAALGRLVAQRL